MATKHDYLCWVEGQNESDGYTHDSTSVRAAAEDHVAAIYSFDNHELAYNVIVKDSEGNVFNVEVDVEMSPEFWAQTPKPYKVQRNDDQSATGN